MYLPCKALSGPRVGRHINACLLLLSLLNGYICNHTTVCTISSWQWHQDNLALIVHLCWFVYLHGVCICFAWLDLHACFDRKFRKCALTSLPIYLKHTDCTILQYLIAAKYRVYVCWLIDSCVTYQLHLSNLVGQHTFLSFDSSDRVWIPSLVWHAVVCLLACKLHSAKPSHTWYPWPTDLSTLTQSST